MRSFHASSLPRINKMYEKKTKMVLCSDDQALRVKHLFIVCWTSKHGNYNSCSGVLNCGKTCSSKWPVLQCDYCNCQADVATANDKNHYCSQYVFSYHYYYFILSFFQFLIICFFQNYQKSSGKVWSAFEFSMKDDQKGGKFSWDSIN